MKQNHPNKPGFTLVEVLIAMVILGIGVTAIMTATARCLSVIGHAKKLEEARSLIARVEVENPILETDMEEEEDSGDFEDAPGFTWHRSIVMEDEENRPGLFEVTTRIEWSDHGRNSFEEVTTYRYCPDAESVTSEI